LFPCVHISNAKTLTMTSEYAEVIFVYTPRIRYSCILVSIYVLNMNILVVPVGYLVEILTEWMPQFFLWENVTVKTFTFFSGVIFFFVSNSVYSESGKIKEGKLSVSQDMSQADTILRSV
jgi:hypothetical protein